MQVYTQVLTFTSSAVQLAQASTQPAAAPNSAWPLCSKILAEPLLSNTHTCYVGVSTVTNDGSGTGVISELAKPGQAAQQSPNHWCLATPGSNRIDVTSFYFHGTSGEKIKVTFYVA